MRPAFKKEHMKPVQLENYLIILPNEPPHMSQFMVDKNKDWVTIGKPGQIIVWIPDGKGLVYGEKENYVAYRFNCLENTESDFITLRKFLFIPPYKLPFAADCMAEEILEGTMIINFMSATYTDNLKDWNQIERIT